LWIVAGVAALQRAWLWFFYSPVTYSDSGAYRHLAEALLGLQRYDGTRTPGYPAFLALLGPDRRVYAAQLVLGFLITLLLFYLGWKVSGLAWFAGLVGLAHSLNLGQLFFEANLLTETLSTFFVIACLAGAVWILTAEAGLWKKIVLAVLVGFSGGLGTLTRPQFIFLPFWIAFLLLVAWHPAPIRLRWGLVAAISLPAILIVASWVSFIHREFGVWGLSSINGYHLVQHTGAFFEYVPDQYAALRDTFLQYRAQQIAQTGSDVNTIWVAIPALKDASGLGFFELSRELSSISIQLILHHPLLYLKSALDGWWWFWRAPIYWSPEAVSAPFNGTVPTGASTVGILIGLVALERGLLLAANLLFVLGSALVLSLRRVRQSLKMDLSLWLMLGTVWLTSIVQTLPEHGENPRFSVPIQSLVVLVILWWSRQVPTLSGWSRQVPTLSGWSRQPRHRRRRESGK
jgi:hypothetical protein